MKPNELNPTDERVMQTLLRQTRGLRWLTGVAIAFWTLAVLASVGVLVAYCIFYAPKEKLMFHDYETYGHLARRTNSPDGSEQLGQLSTEKALGLHFTMSYVTTKGILAIAVSVIILSCGTLATLLLVVLNRRVTLKQINLSLAQISEQLKQLQQDGAKSS